MTWKIRMTAIVSKLTILGMIAWVALPMWSQVEPSPRQEPVPALVGADRSATPDNNLSGPSHPNDRMPAPPPVSGQAYPTAPLSEERSNFLIYGLSFTTAYTDNVLNTASGPPISDFSYSIAPVAELDMTTSRLHWMANYTPGFTFYQHTSARNEADHRAGIDFQYQLSPHVTVSARDTLWKSSSVFNQTDLGLGQVSGGVQVVTPTVIAPIANQLINSGYVGLTYQFGLNDMIGANGTFTTLHYPDPEEVPGLSDSNSQSGSAFYSHRIGQIQYLGLIYQYQRLVAHPSQSLSETQTQAALLFYSVLPSAHLSLSVFGGPQNVDSIQPTLGSVGPLPNIHTLTPALGASANWQGRLTALALSYDHMVGSGFGLTGAVHVDAGTASVTRQINKALSGAVTVGYSQNIYVGSSLLGNSGHSIYGTASLQRQLGQRLGVELGYTHLHQTYAGVEVLSATPDINRGFVSISYQFSKALGR